MVFDNLKMLLTHVKIISTYSRHDSLLRFCTTWDYCHVGRALQQLTNGINHSKNHSHLLPARLWRIWYCACPTKLSMPLTLHRQTFVLITNSSSDGSSTSRYIYHNSPGFRSNWHLEQAAEF
jgi:hypothetical protein